MARFVYKGPIMEFGNLLADHWYGETVADTERKARNNLAYQFKKRNNRTASAKISLPGELVVFD